MTFLRSRWTLFAMLSVCWALTASLLAGYYWLQYKDIVDRISGVLISVNIGIDYGNGTRASHNNTKTVTGATLFDVTKQVFNVTYQVGMWGTEVVSIDNVSKQDSFGWTYWIWNSTSRAWWPPMESADNYRVTNEETFMWYYQDYQSGFNPPS